MPSKPGYIYKPASFIDSLAFASATQPAQAAILARHGTAVVTGKMGDKEGNRAGNSSHRSRSSSLKTNNSSSNSSNRSYEAKRSKGGSSSSSSKPVRTLPPVPTPPRLLPRSLLEEEEEVSGSSLRGVVGGDGARNARAADEVDSTITAGMRTTTTTTTRTAAGDVRGTGLRRADAVVGRPAERTRRRRRVTRAESRSRLQSQRRRRSPSQSRSQAAEGSSRGEGEGGQLDERYLLPAPEEEEEEQERFENAGRQQGEYSTPRETMPIPPPIRIPPVETDAQRKQHITMTRDPSNPSRYVLTRSNSPIDESPAVRVPPPTSNNLWKRLKTHISKSSLRSPTYPPPSSPSYKLASSNVTPIHPTFPSPTHHRSFPSSTRTSSSSTSSSSSATATPYTTMRKKKHSCESYSPVHDPLYARIPRPRTAHFPGELVVRDVFHVLVGNNKEPRVSVYAVEKPMYGVFRAEAGTKTDAREAVGAWVENVEDGLVSEETEEKKPKPQQQRNVWLERVAMRAKLDPGREAFGKRCGGGGVPRMSVVTAWPEVMCRGCDESDGEGDEDEKGVRRRTLRPEDSLSAVQERKWRRGEMGA